MSYRHDELLFHSIQKTYIKCKVWFSVFWVRVVFQLLFYIVAVLLWQC